MRIRRDIKFRNMVLLSKIVRFFVGVFGASLGSILQIAPVFLFYFIIMLDVKKPLCIQTFMK